MVPKIGITMGDPAGIGSEITAKVLTQNRIQDLCIPIVIGDLKVIRQGYEVIQANPDFEVVHTLGEDLKPGHSYVLDLDNISPADYSMGVISAEAGRAAGESIETAIKLALGRKIDAVVTNPIHKESFYLGGYGQKYPGHTEMFAALTGAESYCMMLVSGKLRVSHATTHASLVEAITKYLSAKRIMEVIQLSNDLCRQLGISQPLIGVAAVNPHAGEHGLFGNEEQRIIIPAIQNATISGIKVEGPIPADTLFSKAKGGGYDAVVAMYHDQGHIPCKLEGFVYNHKTQLWAMTGINVTLGLPIIRTSVDHGTAFDRAGKGNSDQQSLYEAVKFAIELAKNRK